MLDLAETGWQIGEKLFALLSAEQRRELAQFVFESETNYAITTIAGKVGYTNTSKFSEAFKKVKGKTPLEYRKVKI